MERKLRNPSWLGWGTESAEFAPKIGMRDWVRGGWSRDLKSRDHRSKPHSTNPGPETPISGPFSRSKTELRIIWRRK